MQIKVSAMAWSGLTQAEKDIVQSIYIVETVAPDAFGILIDNQGVDKSTPGTTAGTNLGEALASATYIDRSFDRGNYSAKEHLGVMILGAMIGSALDSRSQSNFHFRYAIRLGNGNITSQDVFSSEPFRHPAGVCVLLPQVSIAPDQSLCSQTADSLRNAYISNESPPIP